MKTPTLRILGTRVTLLESIRKQAESDLNIKIEYQCHDPETAQRIAVLYPESYDLYDQWFHNLDYVWPVKSIKPIDVDKIHLWDQIGDLAKKGKLKKNDRVAAGGVPNQKLYVQPNGDLGSKVSNRISMLPLVHNVDSFAYHPRFLPKHLINRPESWSWLLDRGFSGKVAVQNDTAIGALDLAMALSANDEIDCKDIGDLSVEEIDLLIAKLMVYKKERHFKSFWSNDEDAYQLLAEYRVNISSIWSPALIRLLRDSKVDVKVATPKEGYRAWFGGIALSRSIDGTLEDIAYQYLNWWLDGWPAAQCAKDGLYFSIPQSVKKYLSSSEWDFWYLGKIATETIYDSSGNLLFDIGSVRDGGSYEEKMSHIGVWNSVMDEHNYLARKWKDFISNTRS